MKSFNLSPVDHVFLGQGTYPVQFLFYYKDKLDIQVLRSSFDSIKHLFWPVAFGRLEEKEKLYSCYKSMGSISIEETVCPGPLPSLDSPHELNPYATDINLDGPLAHIHLYQFPSGSILSVNIAHCLVDGYSFFYFLAMWANIANGRSSFFKKALTKLLGRPIHKRSLLQPVTQSLGQLPDPKSLSPWIFQNTGLSLSTPRSGFTLEKSKWSTFNVTKNDIRQQSTVDFSEPREIGLSWHDLLSAIIWKKTADKWKVSGDNLTLSSAFDFRRVSDRINKRYFGNAVRACGVELSVAHVAAAPIVELGQAIRSSTKAVDAASVDSFLGCLKLLWDQEGVSLMSRLHVADPNNGLLVTNLSRVPTKQLDFGTGAPDTVIPMTPAPRTALVTPHPDGFKVRLSDPAV